MFDANSNFFNSTPLESVFDQIRRTLANEIKNLKPAVLQSQTDEQLTQIFLEKYHQDPPKLDADKKEMLEPEEGEPGYLSFTVCVPYTGDRNLFIYTPNNKQYSSRGMSVSTDSHELKFRYRFSTQDAGLLEKHLGEDLNIFAFNLSAVERQVAQFHQSLSQFITPKIAERRKEVGAQQTIVSSLSIPVRRRTDTPATYAIPEIRRKPEIITPVAAVPKAATPEPTLGAGEYEHILNIIKDMSLAMERSPKTFEKLSEEEIRNFFLIQLNGHYQGNATGETFNGEGKTDILIRYQNANAFIAECKFWTGQAGLTKTINQLLGYVTWRDTKTAILIFHKDKELTNVLKQIDGIVKGHPSFKEDWKLSESALHKETIFGYKITNPADKAKEIYLTVMVFQITRVQI